MPKTREEYNAYMRKYMLARYHRRMREARVSLGGVCVRCGSTTQLELDHVDPKNKNVTIGSELSGMSQKRFETELKLCQLLCSICHDKKTCVDRGLQYVRDGGIHGTLASYRYCKCPTCRAFWNKYCREYKRKKISARSSVG